MANTQVALGAAHVLIGDPTKPDGMIHLGSMESVSFDPGISMLGLSDAFTGDGLMAEAIYALPAAAKVSVELFDIQIEKIKALILGGSEMTSVEPAGSAFGFGGSFKKIEPQTLCVIPAFDADAGVASQFGIWLPAVATQSLASIVYNRAQAGGNANSFTCEFQGARRKTDQSGAEIPVDFRVAFMGSPLAVGLTWQLPDDLRSFV